MGNEEGKKKKTNNKEVKVECYDGAAVQRALDDVLFEFLFQKGKNNAATHEALPLKEITWHKDVRIATSLAASGLAVWMYFRAKPAWGVWYGVALAGFAVLYAFLELFSMFWVRGATCMTEAKLRPGTKAKDKNAYLLPALRITSEVAEFSPKYTLTATWGKGADESRAMEKDITAWIDTNGVVQKELFRADVGKFLDTLIDVTSKKQK